MLIGMTFEKLFKKNSRILESIIYVNKYFNCNSLQLEVFILNKFVLIISTISLMFALNEVLINR
jgi:hypothetical protein